MKRLDALDRGIAAFMQRWGTIALRYSLAVIFIWFGVLKPFGISPAEALVLRTVDWMPLKKAREAVPRLRFLPVNATLTAGL